MRNALRLLILALGLSFAFSAGEVFAAAKTETRTVEATASGIVSESEESDPLEVARQKQKAMDDVNAFLIESYKIKLDKLLDDLYRSVRVAAKDDPALQMILLKRVRSEIEAKIAALSEKNLSPNRKTILLAVFSYLKSDIDSKIRALGEK